MTIDMSGLTVFGDVLAAGLQLDIVVYFPFLTWIYAPFAQMADAVIVEKTIGPLLV